MAKPLKDYVFRGRGRGKYDWKNWLDGRVWELTKGEDFVVGDANMRSIIYGAARDHGLKVTVSIPEEGRVILRVTGPR